MLATTQVCGLRGLGDYEGFYGTAVSLGTGVLGVAANSASGTILSYQDPSVVPNPSGCPLGGRLPAPRNIIGVRSREFVSRAYLRWNSVECASSYVMNVLDRVTGEVRTLTSPGPAFEAAGGVLIVGNSVSIAAVAADGTVGQFSEPVSVLDTLEL